MTDQDKLNRKDEALKNIFKLVTYYRRLWRKEHINPDKLGQLLTLTRKTAYNNIKLRK